jgi:hypothetical protein
VFSAIFQNHVGYLVACTLTALILGGATWALARRLGNAHALWWSGLAFTVTGVCGVTFMGAGPASGVCVLNHQFAEPFHTTQGLWNLAMMVPVGALALLAVRRPLPALVGVIALPLAIEFTQATVDGLGRVCDSSDAEMNIIGGLTGLAIAAAVLTVRKSLLWQGGVKGALIASVALLLLGSGVAQPMLAFTNVDGSGLSAAGTDQKSAAEAAVREAFGDRYTIGQLYEQPCLDTTCKNVIFNLHIRGEKGKSELFGNGSLSWPDKKHLNVLLEDSDRPTAMGYPVKGAKAPTTAREAHEIAQTYARQRESRPGLDDQLAMDPQRRADAQDAGRPDRQGRTRIPDRRHPRPDPHRPPQGQARRTAGRKGGEQGGEGTATGQRKHRCRVPDPGRHRESGRPGRHMEALLARERDITPPRTDRRYADTGSRRALPRQRPHRTGLRRRLGAHQDKLTKHRKTAQQDS